MEQLTYKEKKWESQESLAVLDWINCCRINEYYWHVMISGFYESICNFSFSRLFNLSDWLLDNIDNSFVKVIWLCFDNMLIIY